MYAPGKVLVMGGGGSNPNANPPDNLPTNTAEVIDLTQPSPTWRSVASMAFARRQLNATLLPDGTVLVTGGTSSPGFNDATGAVHAAELWDPATSPHSGQRSPAARASLAFTTLLHCCCPMAES